MPFLSQISLVLDSRVYRLNAVKKAAYRLGGRATSQITVLPQGGIQVILTPLRGLSEDANLEAEFREEVLDQELREQIGEETAQLRNILLAQAFSGLSLTDQVGEDANFEDDPLHIARPTGPEASA